MSGVTCAAGSQGQGDVAEAPASDVLHGCSVKARAEEPSAKQQQQSSPSAAAAAAAAGASQRQQVNTSPATNADAAGGGRIGAPAALSHGGKLQDGAGLTATGSAQPEPEASIPQAAPAGTRPSSCDLGPAQPEREESALQGGPATAGTSSVPTAGAVAGIQDDVAAAAALAADEAQHVQRTIAVHLAREAEAHARTDVRQVWLLEMLAVHPRQAQALCSFCASHGHADFRPQCAWPVVTQTLVKWA